ncbi:unnamed protein product [Cochlearia groenlandica]
MRGAELVILHYRVGHLSQETYMRQDYPLEHNVNSEAIILIYFEDIRHVRKSSYSYLLVSGHQDFGYDSQDRSHCHELPL